MYGTQTPEERISNLETFENDVKMYGTQTRPTTVLFCAGFENDVKFIFANNKDR